ncbi:hypothetical protein CPB84DRAFT_1762425 [Gymnopilus junonius]|uniref:Uncharacterized protein n=1 Tax=Gymnopilus junonius TaxID=109634 RepID=A0A9P5P0S6_GYMJU|nr:hypothetical protein CPB84DRAFT_1762425 [Gymnopilus junonius]
MSPRSALLSHSSLRSVPHSDSPTDLSNGAIDPGTQIRKRSKGKRRQRELEVARPSALSQLLDVDISRKDPTEEVLRLRQILKTVEKHAISEAKRAKELQRANHEVQQRFVELRDNKLLSDREAEKAKQEIRLFQYQLQNAEQEIARSQAAVRSVERQRDDAEAAAARARAKARKLHEEHLVLAAREEGRRLGFEAGFEHARIEREIIAARRKARPRTIPVQATISSVDKGKGKERAYPEDEVESGRSVRPMPERVQIPSQPSPERFDDIESSPDSPSQLHLRNLPDERIPSRPQSQDTSMHTFRPPSDSVPPRPSSQQFRPSQAQPPLSQLPEFPPLQPRSRTLQSPQAERQPQSYFSQQPDERPPQQRPPSRPRSVLPGSQSPGVVIWNVDLPPASQIPEYNSNLFPQNIVSNMPRDQWVTAQKHRELTLTPPQFEGGQPPALLPHPPRSTKGSTTPTKGVRFPNIRPSLKKTKDQAFSWYRSFSHRRKNKPVIDPVPEEDPPPVTASTIVQSEPPTATEPPTTGGSSDMYGTVTQPASSWYQGKQPSGLPAPSVRSTDYAYSSRRRPTSEMDKMSTVSTRVSQFDILATPDLGAQSVRNGKDAKRVREKESYLSAIREDPSSRNNTPNADRYLAGGGMPAMRSRTPIPQPNFGQSQPSLHQQPSYATMEVFSKSKTVTSAPIHKSSEHDVPLPPPGVAYERHFQNASAGGSMLSGRQGYPGLSRKPSRISEKTTPDTSYNFDVIPPSGAVPDFGQSPPHTGVNHLSPYHSYRPPGATSSPRVAPMQSVTSLRSQGGSRLEVPSFSADRPPSSTPSGKKSRQSFHVVNSDPSDPFAQPSPPRPSSRASRAPSALGSGQYKNQSQNPPPPQIYSPRPERPASVKSSASRRPQPQPVQAMASQASLSPYPANADAGPSTSGLVLEPPMHHKKSTSSLRSMGSYSKYNPDGYVDPAFGSSRASMRPASVNSGLSYVTNS